MLEMIGLIIGGMIVGGSLTFGLMKGTQEAPVPFLFHRAPFPRGWGNWMWCFQFVNPSLSRRKGMGYVGNLCV